MCLDMCMSVLRRTRSVCTSCASCVQRVQVGSCIVQPQVTHFQLSFRSSCAWATMDPQLQQLQQPLQILQASGSRHGGASSRPVEATRSGSQANGSQASTIFGFTTPRKPQVDVQASNSPREQTSPPQMQPTSHVKTSFWRTTSHDDRLEWRWLRDVTPKYLYRRASSHWLSNYHVSVAGLQPHRHAVE